MAALTVGTITAEHPDLEWWMHYQIPLDTLHLYFDLNLEERPSKIQPSPRYPNLIPGNGLFTTIARKKGELLCRFPGTWMHMEQKALAMADSNGDAYAFHPPTEDKGWPPMRDLVYITHRCKANKINAGKVGDEVQHEHIKY